MEEMKRVSHSTPPPPPQFTVLGNDDLLREILLLRAALVCKRWYRHASDPDFLRQFRERHPPRILSVYLNTVGRPRPRFFPIRPLPELAAAASRAGSFFDAFADSTFIHQSRWGRLLVRIPDEGHHYLNSTLLSCSPLSIAGNAVVIPPSPPQPLLQQPGLQLESCCVSLPDGGDGGSYLCVVMVAREQQIDVNLYELQDMCWVTRASAAAQLNVSPVTTRLRALFFDCSRFYTFSGIKEIVVCDFSSSSISAMELPDGVENSAPHR